MKGYIKGFLLFCVIIFPLKAEKNPLPRFVSLKSHEVNGRVGPGPDYPIEWVYHKAGLPVEIIAEFDNWRQIRDKEGAKSWVHKNLLYAKRHGIIQKNETFMYSTETSTHLPVACLQQDVVVEILKCRQTRCLICIHGLKGWVSRTSLWGLYPHEIFG